MRGQGWAAPCVHHRGLRPVRQACPCCILHACPQLVLQHELVLRRVGVDAACAVRGRSALTCGHARPFEGERLGHADAGGNRGIAQKRSTAWTGVSQRHRERQEA